jgi:hypothetical protein
MEYKFTAPLTRLMDYINLTVPEEHRKAMTDLVIEYGQHQLEVGRNTGWREGYEEAYERYFPI